MKKLEERAKENPRTLSCDIVIRKDQVLKQTQMQNPTYPYKESHEEPNKLRKKIRKAKQKEQITYFGFP